MTVFKILILRKSPLFYIILKLCRHSRVSSIEIKKAESIVLMCLDDFLTLLPCCLWVVVVHTDHVSRETTSVVYVSLLIRSKTPNEVLVDLSHVLLSLEQAHKKFIL